MKFDHISDHGLSLGIYFRDPDGNGLEVSYELPREQWPRQDQVFAPDVVNLGLFPARGTTTRPTRGGRGSRSRPELSFLPPASRLRGP